MYSVNDAENKGIGWRRWGEEIVYYKNNLTYDTNIVRFSSNLFSSSAPDNPSSNMYSLTWTCKFPNDNDTYYFAHCYPYTYSDLQVCQRKHFSMTHFSSLSINRITLMRFKVIQRRIITVNKKFSVDR